MNDLFSFFSFRNMCQKISSHLRKTCNKNASETFFLSFEILIFLGPVSLLKTTDTKQNEISETHFNTCDGNKIGNCFDEMPHFNRLQCLFALQKLII